MNIKNIKIKHEQNKMGVKTKQTLFYAYVVCTSQHGTNNEKTCNSTQWTTRTPLKSKENCRKKENFVDIKEIHSIDSIHPSNLVCITIVSTGTTFENRLCKRHHSDFKADTLIKTIAWKCFFYFIFPLISLSKSYAISC